MAINLRTKHLKILPNYTLYKQIWRFFEWYCDLAQNPRSPEIFMKIPHTLVFTNFAKKMKSTKGSTLLQDNFFSQYFKLGLT